MIFHDWYDYELFIFICNSADNDLVYVVILNVCFWCFKKGEINIDYVNYIPLYILWIINACETRLRRDASNALDWFFVLLFLFLFFTRCFTSTQFTLYLFFLYSHRLILSTILLCDITHEYISFFVIIYIY